MDNGNWTTKSQCRIVTAQTKHLLRITFSVCDLDISNIALLVIFWHIHRVHKATVRRNIESGESLEHLVVQFWVDLDCILS